MKKFLSKLDLWIAVAILGYGFIWIQSLQWSNLGVSEWELWSQHPGGLVFHILCMLCGYGYLHYMDLKGRW